MLHTKTMTMKLTNTNIYELESLIRDILESIINKIDFQKLEATNKSFKNKMNDRLKYEKDDNWSLFTSSLDIIGDSMLAIFSFCNSNLEDEPDHKSGLKYLKLYGVLSAVYIQQRAIIQLIHLVNLRDLNKYSKQLNELDITFLRHVISAHPLNYNNDNVKENFKIDRNSVIRENKTITIRNNDNTIKTYNLCDSISEYFNLVEPILTKITHKLISNSYGLQTTKGTDFSDKLNRLKR